MAQNKSLQELGEKAIRGEAGAASKYAKGMQENLNALGDNAGSLVTVGGAIGPR